MAAAELVNLLPPSIEYPATSKAPVSQHSIGVASYVIHRDTQRNHEWTFNFEKLPLIQNSDCSSVLITSITTSADDLIVTAAGITSEGDCIVALLKAKDGSAIVTRKLPSGNNRGLSSVSVRYVNTSSSDIRRNVDESGQEYMEHKLLILTQYTSSSNVLLVRYCVDLNGAVVRPQGKDMAVEPILFQIPSLPGSESFVKLQVNALVGYQTSNETLRFMMSAQNGDGGIFVGDYHCQTKQTTMINKPSSESEWNILSKDESCYLLADDESNDPGFIEVDHFNSRSPLFVTLVRKKSNSQVNVVWINGKTLNQSGSYPVSFEKAMSKSEIVSLSLAPIQPFDIIDVASIAIVQKSSIKVIQLLRSGDMKLSKPRTLYCIPISNEHKVVEVRALSPQYSLTFSCVFEKNNTLSTWNSFYVNSELLPIGKFNYLLANEKFDDADELIDSSDPFTNNNIFGSMHGSQVALANLTYILRGEHDISISNVEKMQQAKDCLRRLAAGAVSGGNIGLEALLQSCTLLSKWDKKIEDSKVPSLIEIKMGLSAISAVLSNVIRALTQSDSVLKLSNEQKKIEKKLCALNAIDSIQSKIDPGFEKRPLPLVFLTCKSISDLYIYYVSNGDVSSAEKLRLSEPYESTCAVENSIIVKSILALRNEIILAEPKKIATWVEKAIIPGFSIYDYDLLKTVRSWVCGMADLFDEKRNLSSAITFLKSICKASSLFSAQSLTFPSKSIIKSSFKATLHTEEKGSQHTTPCSNKTLTISSLNRSCPVLRSGGKIRSGIPTKASHPSILQLEGLRSKPARPASSMSQDEYETDDCEQKLAQAIMLYDARELGLSKSKAAMITLRTFDAMGGPETIAIELLRVVCELSVMQVNCACFDNLSKFCLKHSIDFQHIIDRYTSELSNGRDGSTPENLGIIVTLSRACKDIRYKCIVGLRALQNAHICQTYVPKEIETLSNDMLEWSVNDIDTFSQIQEASRLLKVNQILRNYCGHAAIEYFRVAEPDHSWRLLRYICRYVDNPNILHDAFSLCDAFTHLSKIDAGFLLIQNSILAVKNDPASFEKRREQCTFFINQIHPMNKNIGNEIIHRLIIFSDDMINGIRSAPDSAMSLTEKKSLQFIYSFLYSVLTSFIETNAISDKQSKPIWLRQFGFVSWKELLQSLRRVSILQRDHDTFIGCSEMQLGVFQTEKYSITENILKPIIDFTTEWREDDTEVGERFMQLRLLVSDARRGFRVLFGEKMGDIKWFKGAVEAVSRSILSQPSESSRILCAEFLNVCGVLTKQVGEDLQRAAASTITSVVKSLCLKGVRFAQVTDGLRDKESILRSMRYIIQAIIILQEYALVNLSDGECIASLMGLQNLSDLLTNIITRSDAGVGEEMDLFLRRYRHLVQHHRRQSTRSISSLFTNILLTKTSTRMQLSTRFYSSWYIGDGLLLPPLEALKHSMEFCSAHLNSAANKTQTKLYADPNFPDSEDDLFSFLSNRGALNLALRVAITDFSHNGHYRNINDTLIALAERSLGSSGSGIVNGNVDSQLAVVHLMNLSTKKAFKIYGSALPVAMNKRDFARLYILSRVGVQLCSEDELTLLPKGTGWSHQVSFIKQCNDLELSSHWWNVLQTLGVQFEPRKFDGQDGNRMHIEYASSLMSSFIQCASKKHYHPDSILALTRSFGNHFECDPYLAPQKLIEYLLSWPTLSNINEKDTRLDLDLCEVSCQKALRLLPSSIARSAVLRRCVIALEASDDEDCGKDYEKHFRVLAMYRSALFDVIRGQKCLGEKNSSISKMDIFREEFVRIDRRNDTLAILISAFNGINGNVKPNYPKLFLPLPNPFGSDRGATPPNLAGVLETHGTGIFDPLVYFKPAFSEDNDRSLTQALAAISIPLGFPSGFIQARSLQFMFESAAENENPFLPPIETVIGTTKKLANPRDGATFINWCSKFYEDCSDECMQCVELAYSLSLVSSNDAERDRMLGDTSSDGYPSLVKREKQALNELKRLGDLLASLTNTRMVNRILSDFSSTPGTIPDIVRKVLTGLVPSIKTKYGENDFVHMPPEVFVERLLHQASFVTSNKVLEGEITTVDFFRIIALRVHAAAASLDNKYSHVHVGRIARSLAKRWLLHGDNSASNEIKFESNQLSKNDSPNESLEEDDTINFIMDLKLLNKSQVFDEDIGSNNYSSSKGNIKMASIEEPSIVIPFGSMREKSDASLSRSALRVAFMISFAKEYFGDINNDQENVFTLESSKVNRQRKNSGTLLGNKMKQQVSKTDLLKWHAQELLKIVFTNSNLSHTKDHDINRHPLSPKRIDHDSYETVKTVTFIMRRRALETLLVLCPRTVINSVIAEEGYLRDTSCSLENCAYGLFIASEIEDMGLPLPHSDLIHLSMMDRSSYARAIWRDYGRNVQSAFTGRLRMLLIDLCVSQDFTTDDSLIVSLLNDLHRLNLNRSLLCGLEYVVVSKSICASIYNTDSGILQTCFRSALDAAYKEILETHKSSTFSTDEVISVLSRLCTIAERLYKFSIAPDKDLALFGSTICQLCSKIDNTNNNPLLRGLIEVAIHLSNLLTREQMLLIRNSIIDLSIGKSILSEVIGNDFIRIDVT